MRHFTAEEIAERLPYEALIAALKDAAAQSIAAPPRQIINMNDQSKLLLMPAYSYRQRMGMKAITVFEGNQEKGVETIQGLYCLFDSDNGTPLATFDGSEITARRTAATSALAASLLAEADAEKILICGSGKLVPYFVDAYRAIRPKASFQIWARNGEAARRRADEISKRRSCTIEVADALEKAVSSAHIISAVTSARSPFLKGRWIEKGAHLDLVGAHTTEMAEADPTCFRRARVFVDCREAAMEEAGDLIAAINDGAMKESEIEGDLFELSSGKVKLDRAPGDITLFKSVGHAFEDLVAATLVEQGEA